MISAKTAIVCISLLWAITVPGAPPDSRPGAHWALVPPQRPPLPELRHERWARNPVDRFIFSQLEALKLKPSPEADRTTLIRRLSLDLLGLPPTPAEVDAFLSDSSPDAYERLVDRLLRSEHYGERMAVDWLDAARYADSNGYQVDRDREMYAWRDWVIRAFNSNLPFDQFTIEQIAGDLLPQATLDQRIATGFHRNHMMNEEGGVIPEEFLAEYCADRVETTATVWLGQTFNCSRCHDHKFDPFTQRDYYGLLAFFHNVTEKGIGEYGASIRRNNPPMIQLPHPELEVKLGRLRKELTEAEPKLVAAKNRLRAELPDWSRRVVAMPVSWTRVEPLAVRLSGTTNRSPAAAIVSNSLPSLAKGRHAWVAEAVIPAGHVSALKLLFRSGQNTNPQAILPIRDLVVSRWFEASEPAGAGEWRELRVEASDAENAVSRADSSQAFDSKAAQPFRLPLRQSDPASLCVTLREHDGDGSAQDWRIRLAGAIVTDAPTLPVELQLWCTAASADLLIPGTVRTLAVKTPHQRSEAETAQLFDYWSGRDPAHRSLASQVNQLRREIDASDLQIPTALVMEEMPTPRPTHILIRGSYLRPGEEVRPSTPASLPAMREGLPKNRLGLARWLTDPANPLPARVTVNRLWQSLFGSGLVITAEDFGTKGDRPSHPELLDWLATEFIRSGWDVKGMMRLLVTSATYRQSSRWTPELLERDPSNRWLARGPRFRLGAEFIRDQALAASGLLVPRLGGPSVRPYHPPGLYEQVVAGSSASTYVVGQGDDLYRRSLYTYWKRSVPNPAMLLFDMPFREACTLRRPRTNTPLQALNLMNDPTYVEAARMLGQLALKDGGDDAASRLAFLFRRVMSRAPRSDERAVLKAALRRWKAEFSADPTGAKEWLSVGSKPADARLDPIELAAFAAVASTVLNLDEAITKE
ncbi:MAG: DUF1553 domain-containing protein [Verrucomicrobiales bacterium]|nr:DUF1553 domain-containing protein [Verrucomicrobiales bacterium]